MTLKDSDAGEISPETAAAYAERTDLHARIREGHLPDVDQLLSGTPFFGGDIRKDRQVWCDSWLLSVEILKWQVALSTIEPELALRPVIQNMRDVGNAEAVRVVEYVLRKLDHSDADRMLCYLACMGDDDARHRLIAASNRGGSWSHDEFDKMFITATAIGMIYGRRKSMDLYCAAGLKLIETDADALNRYNAAVATAERGKDEIAEAAAAFAQADIVGDVLDDRAEIVRAPLELIVVPKLPESGSGHRRDLQKSWKGIDGTALPVVARGDVAAHRRALVAAWPHAADLIEVILTDLAAREEVRFKPTCLLGPAGSGKSSLLRGICDQLGLPCELYNLAGMADSSLGGTSAQWSTAREAVPLQLIKRSRHASVAIIWDEVEKSDPGKHNGSAMDALLPMLEPDQARRFRDLTLEVECDLSLVTHFATANSLDGIPAPLRDRMRILVMPEPTWQHLGTLTRQIVGRIARERGIDARWFAPLAEDELDLIKGAWPGGSIRQLARIVTTLLDGRDQLMGRC